MNKMRWKLNNLYESFEDNNFEKDMNKMDQMIKKINNKLENSYFPDENDKPKIINRGDQQNYQISAVTSFIFDKWKANF